MSYITKKIRDLMVQKEDLVTLSPDSTILEAARLMEARKIGSILIVKGDKLLGIFTERDIVRTVADGVPSNTNLEVVMTKNVETLKPNDPLSKAAYIISEKGFRHIPILDDEGRLVGIISARDISRYYSEFIEAFE